MQPYFFPYIGYYQLAYDVDTFVFLDNVNFIKKGYINRNIIIENGRASQFTIPIHKLSQNKKINAHEYLNDFSPFLKRISNTYRKSPFFKAVMPVIEGVANHATSNVAIKNSLSIKAVFDYLGLKRDFISSSDLTLRNLTKGQDRIIDICKTLRISEYVNAEGGAQLYDTKYFKFFDINLKFLRCNIQVDLYQDGHRAHYPSIIHALMYQDKNEILQMLERYSID